MSTSTRNQPSVIKEKTRALGTRRTGLGQRLRGRRARQTVAIVPLRTENDPVLVLDQRLYRRQSRQVRLRGHQTHLAAIGKRLRSPLSPTLFRYAPQLRAQRRNPPEEGVKIARR